MLITLFDEIVVAGRETYRFAGDADEPGQVYYECLSASGEWCRYHTSAETWHSFVRRCGDHEDAI